MKVGTLLWLLRHELRLWWREIISKRAVLALLKITIILGLLFAALFVWLWLALDDFRETVLFSTTPDSAIWLAVSVWLVGFFYAFIQAMEYSLIALFERGDLDLLVSSPVSSKVVFASRLLAAAVEVFLSFGLFVVPASLIAVVLGIPQLLGLYPALIGLSLVATSLAMLLTLGLVRLVGARQARTLAQVLTAILSALLFLGLQLPNLTKGTFNTQPVWQRLQVWFAKESPFGADSLIWFPAKAIFFDPLAVLLVLVVSSVLVWFTVETLHRSFITGTQQSVTYKHQQLRTQSETDFASGFNRVVLFKEWRIIWRNPYLISQIFLQILFLIPAVVIMLRGNSSNADISTVVVVASVGIGGVMASRLTQICVSGEEAPDLLKSSPVQDTRLRRLKLLAALIPVWLLLSPLFIILMVRGERWLIAVLIFFGSTICAATLSLWNSRPIRLTDMFRRRGSMGADLLLRILEMLSWFLWIWLGVTLLHKSFTSALFLLLAIALVMAIAYGRSRQLGTS